MLQNLRTGVAGGTISALKGADNPAARNSLRWVSWVVPLGLLLLAGCGGRGDVTGEVTYKGEPLSLGRINFLSEVGKKEVVSAFIIRGKYTLKDCPAGPVKISIESSIPPTPQQLKSAQEPLPIPVMRDYYQVPDEIKEMAKGGPPLKYIPIPFEYANPETSGLTYEVKKGPQTFDIPLKPK